MWDGLLHRNTFRNKCKTALSRTKTRLEVIKKKRSAMQRFLKKDIADLLKTNHDRNAYDRAEGLYNELNLSSCYDYVEQCCACISEHLKQMQKERECPEECKVAVSSLVYAAARFADLPELRDLRSQFNEKYGKSLDSFVSKEFVEKLKPKPPTMEMKLQLMQEIAQEFSLTWDSLPLQQQLHTQGTDNPTNRAAAIGASEKMRRSLSTAGQVKAKQEDGTEKPRTRRHNSCTRFKEDVSEIFQDVKIETSSKNDAKHNPYKRPFTNKIVPAPYVSSNDNGCDTRNEDIALKNKEDNNPNLRYQLGGMKDKNDDALFSKAKPRPRSVRTKFLKPSASSMTGSSEHDINVRESRSARVSQQRKHDIFSDDEDDDDVSGNFRSPYNIRSAPKTSSGTNMSFPTSPENKEENETPNLALPPPPGKRRYLVSPGKEADGQSCSETPSSSGRSKFLPPDYQQQPDSPIESGVSPIRNVKSDSFLSRGGMGHVHPRMPSFDELAERVAALQKM